MRAVILLKDKNEFASTLKVFKKINKNIEEVFFSKSFNVGNLILGAWIELKISEAPFPYSPIWVCKEISGILSDEYPSIYLEYSRVSRIRRFPCRIRDDNRIAYIDFYLPIRGIPLNSNFYLKYTSQGILNEENLIVEEINKNIK